MISELQFCEISFIVAGNEKEAAMSEANQDARRIPYFKNDPFIVLLLGFVTCGLYLIYWNIKMAEVINAVVEKEVITPPVAIFSGCCFPVNLYFYYLVGQNLEVIGRKVGNPALQDQSVLLIVLGFVAPMVSAMIVQGEINKLYN
jgi:hypothetical protein